MSGDGRQRVEQRQRRRVRQGGREPAEHAQRTRRSLLLRGHDGTPAPRGDQTEERRRQVSLHRKVGLTDVHRGL